VCPFHQTCTCTHAHTGKDVHSCVHALHLHPLPPTRTYTSTCTRTRTCIKIHMPSSHVERATSTRTLQVPAWSYRIGDRSISFTWLRAHPPVAVSALSIFKAATAPSSPNGCECKIARELTNWNAVSICVKRTDASCYHAGMYRPFDACTIRQFVLVVQQTSVS
jgi:hypothetical protein